MAKRSSFSFAIAFFALLALYPLTGGEYGLDLLTKIMVFAVLALSLELLVGTTGLVCFGQAALFGVGAYGAVQLSIAAPDISPWWLLPAAVAAGAAYAAFMGSLSLRTKGVYFIMVTLAFAQMAYYIIHDTALGGGTDGIYLNAKPVLSIAGRDWLDLGDTHHFYFFTLSSLLLVYAFLSALLRSRFGRALAGIKANEQRMRATGFSTYPYKLAAFVLSGAIAGFAGFLFAVKDGYVNPELLSWHMSGVVLVMIILGGLGHLKGSLVGAFAFVLMQELFKSESLFGAFAQHWHLGLGLVIIFCVASMPNGLVGVPAQLRQRLAGMRKPVGVRDELA